MIWLIFAVVILMVFGVLDMPSTNLPFLGADDNFYIMSILLVGCAFLCLKFNQLTTKTLLAKTSLLAVNALLIVAVALLFVIRTLSVNQDFEEVARLVPKQGYTITADVHISEISDGVYADDMYYRQKAQLSNLQFYEGAHQGGANTYNPFLVADGGMVSHQPLPKTLTVMLQAGRVFEKNKTSWDRLNQLHPNTTAQMTLWITPIDTEVSASGFDGGRWLRTRHIHANAQIIAINGEIIPLSKVTWVGHLENFRQTLRDYFYQDWQMLGHDQQQAKAVTLSLLTGDRALIGKDTKELYQFGGISHLLAISGAHVVFLAMILAYILCSVADRFLVFYQVMARHHFRMMVMVLASLVYALFTGFDVPAVRTVYMMLMVSVASYLALPISSMTALAWVALVMIWLDPVVVWQAGFWLSFVAVALLMWYGEREFESAKTDFVTGLMRLIKLQSYLFVAMLPISLLLFGKVSLWGLVVNLFAVGLFGALIVPINLLAGVFFIIMPSVASVLWGISSFVILSLNAFLMFLQEMGSAWLYQNVSVAGVLLAMMAVGVWISPLIHKKFAFMPVLAMLMMLVQGKSVMPKMGIHVLNSDDDYVSQVLIFKPHANDGTSKTAWLLLADQGSKQSPELFAKTLLTQLHKQNINHLTGVIIQTPSPMMAEALSIIHRDIPIHRPWLAGKNEVLGLPYHGCEAGRSWEGDGLYIRALTGWQMIDDEHVWSCSVFVESEEGITIMGGIRHDIKEEGSHVYRVLINGANHAHVWQMYEYMCYDEVLADVWLAHTRQVVSRAVFDATSPYAMIYTDKNTATNREKASVALASLTD